MLFYGRVPTQEYTDTLQLKIYTAAKTITFLGYFVGFHYDGINSETFSHFAQF